MMRIALITNAGISSRFNEGIPEENKALKAIYYENDNSRTLLYHQLLKCRYADRIVMVGGYKVESLKEYCRGLEAEITDKLTIVVNDRYQELGSGYSLYMGLEEAFKFNPDEILFVEGDLDIDSDSFAKIISSEKSVLTYTYELIYANKAVVLYKDDRNRYRYAFNSSHGLLAIESPFSCILNSGQIWKFRDIEALKRASDSFFADALSDTNLRIIQNYLDQGVEVDLVPLRRWTNCNTRDDYKRIVSYWEAEDEDII